MEGYDTVYIGRAIGINDNCQPNSDFPNTFYVFVLNLVRKLNADLSVPRSSRYYYALAIKDIATLVRPMCQIKRDSCFHGLIWKEIWKLIYSGLEDPLHNFDWRSVHLVLNVDIKYQVAW